MNEDLNNFDNEQEDNTQNQNENNTDINQITSPENQDVNEATNNEEFHYKWENGVPLNGNENRNQKKHKNGNGKLKIFVAITTVLTVLSISSLIFVLVMNQSPFINGNTSDLQSEQSGTSESSASDKSHESFNVQISQNGDALTLQEIAQKLDQSTVTVYCTTENNGWGTSSTSSYSFGSGFVISEDGYIVTNHHVIDGSQTIKVIFYDETEYEATLVGSDSLYDIAVLKIEGENFVPVELGSSDDLVIGDMVIAIGTPYSLDLAGTHTFGFISATDRKIKVTSGSSVIKTMTMLQTDATLNSGNSGGPLVNMKGQVIGINTMKLVSDYEGIGFAIPMSDAVDIINQLVETGTVTDPNGSVTASPYLGVKVGDVTESDAELYDVPMGALITYIEPTGSAYAAGLRRNDIITEFAGDKIESVDDLLNVLNKHEAGDTVTIKVYHNEETVEITFKLDARTD
ncbi:MAG: hypothetical protein A2Y17_09135 [Clostridiales bacterium GWF2_38_85]|nr:MAG: hypothetical protein A2Y17_09135 [Clostridiales bacterium GWF2_38_85]HBL83639.1 peptidase S1 [Clostridiales bacterium]